jgi:hypothetical protein
LVDLLSARLSKTFFGPGVFILLLSTCMKHVLVATGRMDLSGDGGQIMSATPRLRPFSSIIPVISTC